MLLGGLNGAKERISGTNLWEARSKADLDVDDCHPGSASMIENACGSSQESVFAVFGVDGNNSGLTIHAQHGGVGRVNRKWNSHIEFLFGKELREIRIVVQSDAQPQV